MNNITRIYADDAAKYENEQAEYLPVGTIVNASVYNFGKETIVQGVIDHVIIKSSNLCDSPNNRPYIWTTVHYRIKTPFSKYCKRVADEHINWAYEV